MLVSFPFSGVFIVLRGIMWCLVLIYIILVHLNPIATTMLFKPVIFNLSSYLKGGIFVVTQSWERPASVVELSVWYGC